MEENKGKFETFFFLFCNMQTGSAKPLLFVSMENVFLEKVKHLSCFTKLHYGKWNLELV